MKRRRPVFAAALVVAGLVVVAPGLSARDHRFDARGVDRVTCAVPRRLVREDAAHGLVTYVLDGQVHVLPLADGADTTVATGTLARFTDAGLVYASGNKLRIVPFAQLE